MSKPKLSEEEFIQCSAFRVTGGCGRVWEVPLKAVRRDYVRFLMEEDGVTQKEALAQATKEAVETWFHEQFDWSDIEQYGKMVKGASAAKIEEALNLLRGSFSQSHTKQLLIPEKLARLKARRLDEKLEPAAGVSSKPRL